MCWGHKSWWGEYVVAEEGSIERELEAAVDVVERGREEGQGSVA